jgi:hypothetical protein
MSVATYLRSGKPRPFESRLRKLLTTFGCRCGDIIEAVAEARLHRAMIEAELYLKRCKKHSSKNDDDLPVLR